MKTLSQIQQKIPFNLEAISQFCQQWNIQELALFGSILREDFTPESDIDILVAFSQNAKITLLDLETMESQLSQLFNRKIDLVSKRAIEKSYNWIRRQNILENSQIIYVKQ
ncbi:MAG: nucleotidyltransferase family protein [Microcystaceae cyanobacterium]